MLSECHPYFQEGIIGVQRPSQDMVPEVLFISPAGRALFQLCRTGLRATWRDMGLMLKTLDALMFGGCEMGTISTSSTLWWTNILQWKITMLLMGTSTISMAIFHCNVSSPEGSPKHHTDIKPSIIRKPRPHHQQLTFPSSRSPDIPAKHQAVVNGSKAAIQQWQGIRAICWKSSGFFRDTWPIFHRGYSEKGSTIFNRLTNYDLPDVPKKNWVSCHLPWFLLPVDEYDQRYIIS